MQCEGLFLVLQSSTVLSQSSQEQLGRQWGIWSRGGSERQIGWWQGPSVDVLGRNTDGRTNTCVGLLTPRRVRGTAPGEQVATQNWSRRFLITDEDVRWTIQSL